MPDQGENANGAKRATFGMGCFWACDALYGATPGVLTTAVGYSGGSKESPVYKNLGDHTEVVDVVYDPELISYGDLLNLFWDNHEYGLLTKLKRQYMSLILYHDEEQRIIAEESRAGKQRQLNQGLLTEVKKFEKFYPAEDYHQKYRLQKFPWLVENIGATSGELLRSSPLAAKLNGFLGGVVDVKEFDKLAPTLGINDNIVHNVRKHVIEVHRSGVAC